MVVGSTEIIIRVVVAAAPNKDGERVVSAPVQVTTTPILAYLEDLTNSSFGFTYLIIPRHGMVFFPTTTHSTYTPS